MSGFRPNYEPTNSWPWSKYSLKHGQDSILNHEHVFHLTMKYRIILHDGSKHF